MVEPAWSGEMFEMYECPECHGFGKHKVPQYDQPLKTLLVFCFACQGYGRVSAKVCKDLIMNGSRNNLEVIERLDKKGLL